jgi:hypothetical protein
MTDTALMEADCIHGIVWYDCTQCIKWEEPMRYKQMMNEMFSFQKEDDNPKIVDVEGNELVKLEYTPDNTIVCTFDGPVVIPTAVDQEMILVPLVEHETPKSSATMTMPLDMNVQHND